jgi:pimeloyl-ACP methyl ester carboxylesterase
MRTLMMLLGAAGFLVAAGFGLHAAGLWSPSKGGATETPLTAGKLRLTEAEDRYVEIAGATVRIRESGPARGPVILMLHGFTFSLESWDALADELDSDYRVVRYDLLGHGLTGPDAEERYAPEDRAAFAGQLIEALELKRPVLVGNSLGGLVSWRLAAMQPDKVRAMVLISPGAFPFNGVTEEPAPVPAPVAFYLRNPTLPLVRASFAGIYADASAVEPERVELAYERMKDNGDAFVRALELFTLPEPTEELGSIRTPTLILWGQEDRVIPAEHGTLIEDAMPNAELKIYENVGHVAHEEIAGEVAKDIRAFLGELEGARG